jgi:hypothetical protein
MPTVTFLPSVSPIRRPRPRKRSRSPDDRPEPAKRFAGLGSRQPRPKPAKLLKQRDRPTLDRRVQNLQVMYEESKNTFYDNLFHCSRCLAVVGIACPADVQCPNGCDFPVFHKHTLQRPTVYALSAR